MSKQSFTTGQVLTAAQVNSLQANDFNQTVSVKTANYTLAAADKGTRIEFNTSGSVTCTVNSGLFDAGDTLVIQNRGAGTATITAGTATVNTSASLALAQYSAGTLYFVSDSAALFFGDAAGISASIVDAKGDLIVGTADNTVGRLAVGTDGYTLVADSSTATGLAYAAPSTGALTKITSATFTTVSSVSLPAATFSSTYLNYKVIFVTDSATATGAALTLRLRISGTDNTTANHYGAIEGASAGATENIIGANGLTSFPLGTTDSPGTNGSVYAFDIINPFASIRTDITGVTNCFKTNGTGLFGSMGFFFNGTTSFDALSFIVATGTMTGHYKVYGYEN